MNNQAMANSGAPPTRILPQGNVIQVGGRSIMDRGRTALLPLLEEVIANQAHYLQLIGVGPGVRSRHLFSLGLDLGLPPEVLVRLSAQDAAQNAYMVSCLLARHGFIYLEGPFLEQDLSAILAAERGVVFDGMPGDDLWEYPPSLGKVPAYSGDVNSYLVAETFGARRMIFIKDVDGLYTADPKTDPQAKFIAHIRVAELMALKLPSLPIDSAVLDLLARAKQVTRIQIINGLVPGNLTRTLADVPVGTVIDA